MPVAQPCIRPRGTIFYGDDLYFLTCLSVLLLRCVRILYLWDLVETSESKSSESSMVALLWRQFEVAKTASELDPDPSPDPPTTSTSGSSGYSLCTECKMTSIQSLPKMDVLYLHSLLQAVAAGSRS